MFDSNFVDFVSESLQEDLQNSRKVKFSSELNFQPPSSLFEDLSEEMIRNESQVYNQSVSISNYEQTPSTHLELEQACNSPKPRRQLSVIYSKKHEFFDNLIVSKTNQDPFLSSLLQTPKHDPFVDQSDTVKKVKKFEIKSPLNAGFNSFLGKKSPSNLIFDQNQNNIPSKENVNNMDQNENWMDADEPGEFDQDFEFADVNDENIQNSLEINQKDLSMMEKSNNLIDLDNHDSDGDSTIPDQTDNDFSWDNRQGGSLVTDDFFQLRKDPINVDLQMPDLVFESSTDSANKSAKLDDNILPSNNGGNSLLDESNQELSWDNNHEAGSLVADDFFELKKEMDKQLPNLDFPSFSSSDSVFSTKPVAIIQTPQNLRTISADDQIFSPGSFFASRSGHLGDLENRTANRPMWFTPKHDAQGRLIDPIGKTPANRPEKDKPRPLYILTPSEKKNNSISSTEIKVDKISTDVTEIKLEGFSGVHEEGLLDESVVEGEVDDGLVEMSASGERSGGNVKDEGNKSISEINNHQKQGNMSLSEINNHQKQGDLSIPEIRQNQNKDDMSISDIRKELGIENPTEIDPFDWEAALDATIPDTVVDQSTSMANLQASLSNSCSTGTGMKSKSSINSGTGTQSIYLSTHAHSFRFDVKSLKRKPIRIKISVINDTAKSIVWSFKPVGPSTFHSNGHSKLVEDSVFKIEKSTGKLLPGGSMKLSVLFVPVLFGVYTSLFHLKIPTGVVTIWIDASSVESSKSNNLFKSLTAKSDDIMNRSMTVPDVFKMDIDIIPKTPLATGDETKPLKNTTTGGETKPLKKDLLRESSTPQKIGSTLTTKTPLNSKKLPLPLNSAFSTRLESPQTIRHKLDFGKVEIGQGKRLYLKISNPDNKPTKVTILATGDFVIPIRDLEMTPRTFFILPICFYPKIRGLVAERLIVRRDKSVLRVTLEGIGAER